VDDEKSSVFRYAFNNGKYEGGGQWKIGEAPDPCAHLKPDDLEGVAAYQPAGESQKLLYLVTSHSNPKNLEENKSGGTGAQASAEQEAQAKKEQAVREKRRRMFLEVSLGGEGKAVVKRCADLRGAIEQVFQQPINEIGVDKIDKWVEDGDERVMEIEGLAMDETGNIYLGFRAPVIKDRYALVLRTTINDVFTGDPKFKTFVIDLTEPGSKEVKGIVSMEYDGDSTPKRLIIVSAARNSEAASPAYLWTWTVDETRALQTNKESKLLFEPFPGINAKPEALVLPPGNQFFTFFDHRGYGGQLSYTKKDYGLQPGQ
jgi:hypothetical protein